MRNIAVVRSHLVASLKNALAYRLDFVVDAITEGFWIITTLVPLLVVFRGRDHVAGWSFGEALMVSGHFTLMESFVEGVIGPSLMQVTERIRNGTFDFVLLKPVDTQVIVSVGRVQVWKSTNAIAALAFFVFGFWQLGRAPALIHVLLSLLLLTSGTVILYSFWLMAASLAFYVVRVDNITYLFTSIFDAARWPRSVFRGAIRAIFTFVIPILVMTSLPAEALLGKISAPSIALSLALAVFFGVVSRLVWTRSIARYTSAGG